MSQEVLRNNLSQRNANIEQLASDFLQQFTDHPSQLHVELVNMICYSCNVPVIPQRMIENGDVTAIDAFLRKRLKPSAKISRDSIKDLISSKLWPNIVNFFHHVIDYKWDLLSGETKFDSFFVNVLNVFITAELPALRYFGSAIQLEFVAVCSHEKCELLQNQHRASVLKYTISILQNSFHDYERKIWAYALSQMHQWFQRNAFLLEENVLRFLLWGVSDRSIANSHFCVQICVELLDEHHEKKESLAKFVQSLLRLIAPALSTQNVHLFEKLCDLAFVMYHKYPDMRLRNKFVEMVFRFTFAPERAKAKMAANVFVRTELYNLSAFEQVRRIAQFLVPENSVFVELFVDAAIDMCPLLMEWHTLADALHQLSEACERETLLLVILCVVRLMIDGEGPFIRNGEPDIQPSDNIRVTISSVFGPLLGTLPSENVSFRWKLLVMKLATYFDLDYIQRSRMAIVIKEFLNLFNDASSPFDVVHTITLLQLVIAILQHNNHGESAGWADNMRKCYEKDFVDSVRKLHLQSTPVNLSKSSNVFIGMYAWHRIDKLDERCLFDVPVGLLQEIKPESDPSLFMCHELAIIFCSDYVIEMLCKPDSSSSENGIDEEHIVRIELVFTLVCECLSQHYYSRIGELAFFALCRMAKALFAANVSESQRNSVFTDLTSGSLCTFVALALRNLQPTQLPSSFELSTYSTEKIIEHFAQLILSHVLPLTYAYEFLHAHCHQTTKIEKELRKFLLNLVDCEPPKEIARWIFNYFAEYFRMADEDLLCELEMRAKHLSQLLQSVRHPLTDVLIYAHKLGIDFAVSRVTTRRGLAAVKFLSILVEFSPCLLRKAKEICFEYFISKQIVGNVEIAKLYFRSLCVKKSQSTADDTESTFSEEPDVCEPQARRSRISASDSSQSEPESKRSSSSFGDYDSLAMTLRSFRQSPSIFSDNSR